MKLRFKLKEDGGAVPTNNAGGGSVAGIGVGPNGEPGVSPEFQPGGKKKRFKNAAGTNSPLLFPDMMKRTIPSLVKEEKVGHALVVNNEITAKGSKRQMVSHAKKHHGGLSHEKGIFLANTSKKVGDKWKDVVKEDTFAGAAVFEVSSHVFHTAKMEKRKHKTWRKYLEEDDCLAEIREYANKHPHKPIVLKNRTTGEMLYARYGKRG